MGNELERQGMKWNREETILAFELYCRTPFGKIHKQNKDVIELADLLRRTPGSVGMKMSNLAHCDPSLRARGISGMAHGSKLDADVFDEYSQDLGELIVQARSIKERMGANDPQEVSEFIDVESIPPGEYRERITKERLGQYSFRMAILNSYHNRCCVTGLAVPKLLIASHIKPWAKCDEKTERTNPRNGLCLNPLHDRAFDQGLMTIAKDYKIVFSSKLRDADMDETTRDWLLCSEGRQIELPERFRPSKEFIEYHNDVIFLT